MVSKVNRGDSITRVITSAWLLLVISDSSWERSCVALECALDRLLGWLLAIGLYGKLVAEADERRVYQDDGNTRLTEFPRFTLCCYNAHPMHAAAHALAEA